MTTDDLTGRAVRLRSDAPYRDLVGKAQGVVQGVKPTIAPHGWDERGPVYLVRFSGPTEQFPYADTANYGDELEIIR